MGSYFIATDMYADAKNDLQLFIESAKKKRNRKDDMLQQIRDFVEFNKTLK